MDILDTFNILWCPLHWIFPELFKHVQTHLPSSSQKKSRHPHTDRRLKSYYYTVWICFSIFLVMNIMELEGPIWPNCNPPNTRSVISPLPLAGAPMDFHNRLSEHGLPSEYPIKQPFGGYIYIYIYCIYIYIYYIRAHFQTKPCSSKQTANTVVPYFLHQWGVLKKTMGGFWLPMDSVPSVSNIWSASGWTALSACWRQWLGMNHPQGWPWFIFLGGYPSNSHFRWYINGIPPN